MSTDSRSATAAYMTEKTNRAVSVSEELRRQRNPSVKRVRGSFTVEAALLMTVILPVLLALIYLGLFLMDRGVLSGAAQETAALADLGRWKSHGNDSLSKKAGKLARRAGLSEKVSSSVSVSKKKVTVSFSGTMRLPGLLPRLFGKSVLDTGASTRRALPRPADVIRTIRGFEYASEALG